MSGQSCRSVLKAENWSGSAPGGAPLQVLIVDEHVDIVPLLTAWSRLQPREPGGGSRTQINASVTNVMYGASRRAQITSSCLGSCLSL